MYDVFDDCCDCLQLFMMLLMRGLSFINALLYRILLDKYVALSLAYGAKVPLN